MQSVAPVLVSLIFVVVSSGACEHSLVFSTSYANARDSRLSISARQQAFESAIHECPGNVRLYGELSALLIANREFQSALAWIDKALKLSPDDHALQIQRATALLPLGRAREVLSMLAPVSTAEARFYSGMAYRSLDDHLNSRRSFLQAWTLGYKDPYLLYSIIQEDYALGDKRGGLEQFQLLLRQFPDSPWVHLLLADAYFTKEQTVEARSEYLKALNLKPDLLEANFRLGYMAFQEGDRDAAARYFLREVSLNPTYVDAHLFLAETYLQLDRKDDALLQLRRALALDNNSDLIYKRLATTLIETNQLQEASSTLKRAEVRFPQDPSFPAQLARVFTLLNQTHDARDQANRARQLTADQHRQHQISPPQ